MSNMYSVKLPSRGKCILWCDEHWYETIEGMNPIYTKEQAEAVVKQLRSHYQYNAVVVDENGVELSKPKVNPMKIENEPAVKKSFFRKF